MGEGLESLDGPGENHDDENEDDKEKSKNTDDNMFPGKDQVLITSLLSE